MNLTEIRDRLRTQAMPPLRLVDSVASAPAAQGQARGVPQSPAAYTVLLGEDAQANRYSGNAHAQQVATRFGVLLAVRELSDAKGGAAAGTLDSVRDVVIPALIGWQPVSADQGIDFLRGSLIDIQDGVLWWLDEFGTTFDLRN